MKWDKNGTNSTSIGRNQQIYGDDEDDEKYDDLFGEGDEDAEVLANPDEQLKNVIQLQQIQQATKGDGRTRFPVKELAMAENSQQFRLTVHHPFEDHIRFFLKKPRTWDSDQELVRFLDLYDYKASNIYELQTGSVYVVEDDVSLPSSLVIGESQCGDWRLVAPPDTSAPRRERAMIRAREMYAATSGEGAFAILAMLMGIVAMLPSALLYAEGGISPVHASLATLLAWLVGVGALGFLWFMEEAAS